MKRIKKNYSNLLKGAPSGLVISLMVHVAAFMLAGLLVVFTVQQKQEKKFVPPKPVERPKMKLKKPKVKVKKTAKPKPTTRIVTKIKRAGMPDIQLPEMSGMGGEMGAGLGGFDLVPDLNELTVLGSSQSIGNDLEGVYYDMKFTRNGVFNPPSEEEWRNTFHRFFRNGWNINMFSKYYRAPKKLYSTCLVMPPIRSAMAPVSFGMDDSMASGGMWILYYKGSLVYKEDITFRFWVSVDDSLAIRLDGEVVLAASFISPDDGISQRAPLMYHSLWESSSMDSEKYQVGQSLAIVGDWVTLKAGVPKRMEVVITDNIAQNASFILFVEVKGEDYPKGVHNGPLLPIFKTAELTRDHLDIIYRSLADEEVDCVNGPVFRDY